MMTFAPAPSVRALGALLLVFFAAGCSDQGPESDLLQHVQNARARWNTVRPDRYTYDLRRSCECTPEMTGPVSVLVEGVSAVGWTYQDGSPVSEDLRPHFPSVDGLLDMIEDAIRRRAWDITVQYDVETGVPIQFRLDYDRLVFDEEASYRVVAMPRVPGA